MNYEQKRDMLEQVVENYKLGFITLMEMIGQIQSMDWNPLERQAVNTILEKSIKIDTVALNLFIKD